MSEDATAAFGGELLLTVVAILLVASCLMSEP